MKKYFVTGLLIWVPLVITLWVLNFIFSTMDEMMPARVTNAWHGLFGGVHIPGFGLLIAAAVVFVTGLLTANFIGSAVVRFWEAILARIPIVRGIYSSVKQVSDTVLSPNGQAFRKAVLVQFPREGIWTIAFLTGAPGAGVAEHLPADCVSVYVPTTPNPTGGYFIMLPKKDVVELAMSVDEALKHIVSMGVVSPTPSASSKK
jgi:uncharacterized membrane protein